MNARYVLYVCSCGNYVAEPTLAPPELPGHVTLAGHVMCTAASHGALQPEMRRIEVSEEARA